MQPQLSNSCCFSGHRPDKLPPEQSPEGQRLRALLREMVCAKLREGCTHFYCGMAGARISGLPRQFSRWPWNSRPWASASIPWFLSPGRRGNREPPIIPAITPFCGSPNRRGIFLPDTPSPVTICETGQWWTPAAIFFLFSMEARAERRKPYAYAVQKQRKRLVYDPKTRRLYTWPHKESIASILNTFPL